jgi:hypothetical protein
MDLTPYAAINPCGYRGHGGDADESDLVAASGILRGSAKPSPSKLEEQLKIMTNAASRTGAAKTARIPIKMVPAETVLKKPSWIRVKAGNSAARFGEIKQILREHQLHTVCEEATCPNIGECFGNGHRHLHDPRRPVHPALSLLRRRPRQAAAAGCRGTRKARAHHRGDEAQVRRHHQRGSRRPA